jgi:hypothetical protein
MSQQYKFTCLSFKISFTSHTLSFNYLHTPVGHNFSQRKIPLIWHPYNWAGIGLLDIQHYQTEPVPTYFLTGNFLLLAAHMGCTTNQTYSIWISPSAATESSGSSYVFSGVFKPEQVDGVGE